MKASNRASSTISCPEERLFLMIELFPILFELGPSELGILSEFCFRDFDDSLDNSPDELWSKDALFQTMNVGKIHLRQHPQQSEHSFSTLNAANHHRHPKDLPTTRKGTYYRATACGMTIFIVMLVSNWMAYYWIPPFILDDDGQRHLQLHHPQPWTGYQALVPTLQPNINTTQYHVRIIIRVHHEHKELVQGLIHNLRHQQQFFGSPTLSMDFALVPTELAGVPVTQEIARDFWSNPLDPFPHVYAVNLNESFFVAAKDRAASLKCTSKEAKEIARKHSKNAVRKVCQYDNHVYYQATDVAVQELLEGCNWCTHMLVTNDDNGYHPDFFRETLLTVPLPVKGDEPPKKKRFGNVPLKKQQQQRVLTAVEERRWDLVTTDFTTNGFYISAELKLGRLDLGGMLFSKEIVRKVGGFIAALPAKPRAIDAHNADWLFAEKAMIIGALAMVVKKLLFFHN